MVLQIKSSLEDIRKTIDRIKEIDKQLEALAKETKNYERFKTAPGVGSVTAAMLCVLLAEPSLFRNGRQFAAYLGLAPMSFGSGGKNIFCSIPKKSGNIAVRALMVQCAHSKAKNSYPSGWVESILKGNPKKWRLSRLQTGWRTSSGLWPRRVRTGRSNPS
ncbi:MAG: IS110 family transposase [Burkholderiales bacterium]|nr:IS110 family transposase [Burkholderiales bacterium]